MWFFKRQRNKEAEIQAIKVDLLKKAEEAQKSAKKLNKLLDDPDLGITGYIFYGTGGDRRIKRQKK